jgi:hypothetical protein
MYAFQRIEDELADQWSGVGAQPGKNLAPRYDDGSTVRLPPSRCPGRDEAVQSTRCTRHPVMAGMSIGPHAFDTMTVDSIPAICSDTALPYSLPWRDVFTDPMDGDHMWNPPTSGTTQAKDPYQPWTYTLGAWP